MHSALVNTRVVTLFGLFTTGILSSSDRGDHCTTGGLLFDAGDEQFDHKATSPTELACGLF